MNVIKARGFVIKEFEASESDKRLVVLCKGYGRMTVYARGAKKPNSKFLSAAQLFAYSDYVLAQGRGFYSLTQADVIRSFYEVREDYDSLMAAHLFAEVCNKSTYVEANLDELMFLTLTSLSKLTKKTCPPSQVSTVFLYRALAFHGLKPIIYACASCKKPWGDFGDSFYVAAEGLVCHGCGMQKRAVPVSKAALYALSHILESQLNDAYRFEAVEGTLDNLMRVALFLWEAHFDITANINFIPSSK